MLEARGFPKQAYAHSESFSLGGGTAEELLAKRCAAPLHTTWQAHHSAGTPRYGLSPCLGQCPTPHHSHVSPPLCTSAIHPLPTRRHFFPLCMWPVRAVSRPSAHVPDSG